MKRKREGTQKGGVVLQTLEDGRSDLPPLADVVAAAAAEDTPAVALGHLLHPLSVQRWEREVYQRCPLLLRRKAGARGLLTGLLSKAMMEELLLSTPLHYGQHLDVTSYTAAGGRSTLNEAEEVVDPADVWRHYAAGCSIRLLHPQRWVDSIHALLAVLERHFNCACGSNAYLTPPGTQGFAPHYDDVDVFVCQLEGAKRWRLYPARAPEEVLPRWSSANFSPEEVGLPLAELVLHAGDVLYLPRGCIHEARALTDQHSLHLTCLLYTSPSPRD
jgi:lysine-specific demethylase/histidyl-hydroxylase NO66